MISVVLDTHAAIWYLFGDARLSQAARQHIDSVLSRGDQIGLSTITLAEIVYLEEKRRIPPRTLVRLLASLDDPGSALIEIPVDRQVIATLPQVDRRQVPDLPDRIIAATALRLGVPVATRDNKIRSSGLRTIW